MKKNPLIESETGLNSHWKRISICLICSNGFLLRCNVKTNHLLIIWLNRFHTDADATEIGAPLNYNEKLSSLWILSDSIVHRSHVYQSICNEFPIMMFSIVRQKRNSFIIFIEHFRICSMWNILMRLIWFLAFLYRHI